MLSHNLPNGIVIDGAYDASEDGDRKTFIILVYRIHDHHPWVVARYDGVSTEWDSGNYFDSEVKAIKYFTTKILACRNLSG